jgi:hypothetical protein
MLPTFLSEKLQDDFALSLGPSWKKWSFDDSTSLGDVYRDSKDPIFWLLYRETSR